MYWFDSWAVQLSLTLTTDEKGTISPNGNAFTSSPVDRIFNIDLGLSASSEAQRVDKIGAFFTVKDFKGLKQCNPLLRQKGPFILQSDLKLFEWLQAAMVATGNNDTPPPPNVNGPLGSNVLSHQVKFEIQTIGNLNPGFKLVNASVNQGDGLLSATRSRTQDVTFTFGPADTAWLKPVMDPVTNKPIIDLRSRRPVLVPTQLAPAANTVFLANEIGTAVASSIRSSIRP